MTELVVDRIATKWAARIEIESNGQNGTTQASILNWLLGEDRQRWETFDPAQLKIARGYTTLAQSIVKVIKKPDCVETHGLDRGQIAAFQHYGGLSLKAAQKQANCLWLLVDRDATQTLGEVVTPSQWTPQFFGYRPTDRDDDVLLYRRTQP